MIDRCHKSLLCSVAQCCISASSTDQLKHKPLSSYIYIYIYIYMKFLCPSTLKLQQSQNNWWHPILYFQSSSSQSDSRHFHLFNHTVLAASATALSGHFLPTGISYLMLLHRHFNLCLSRLPWEPAVLPWSLQGFILMILETQTQPICLFDSQ